MRSFPTLADVQARVKADLIKKMQADKAKADAEAMAADLRDGKAFAENRRPTRA
jgi:hypothetical protein